MKRIGVFVDLSNLYYSLKPRKLDYQKYYDFIKDFGQVTVCIAYGAQMGTEAEPFIARLKDIGFTPKYKEPKTFATGKRKADWDVGIAVDMIEQIDNIDLYILGSADSDMLPVIEHLKNLGKEIIVIAAGISHDFIPVAKETIEIAESLYEVG